MENYLDYEGLRHYHSLLQPLLKNKATSSADNGVADRIASIPFTTLSNTSTGAAFVATVNEITELRDGVCFILHNNVIASAAGFTLNVNGFGAKPVYNGFNGSRLGNGSIPKAYTFLLYYNSLRDNGNGGWDVHSGYNDNTQPYDVRIYHSSVIRPATSSIYGYQLLLTKNQNSVICINQYDRQQLNNKVLTTESFDPFGEVYYYASATAVSKTATLANAILYSQLTSSVLDLRYSFNTGTSLIAGKNIYLVCLPQADGSAVLYSNPIVQELPDHEDGLIYKKLGTAYDTYRMILLQHKPVYYYRNGSIRNWSGEIIRNQEYTFAYNYGDSNGKVDIIGIKGNTLIWNQLCSFNTATLSQTNSGSSGTHYSTGLKFSTGNITNHRIYTKFVYTVKQGHNCSNVSTCLYSYQSGNVYAFNSISLSGKTPGQYTASCVSDKYSTNQYTNTYQSVELAVQPGDTVDIEVNSFIAIDLTVMFGENKEPTTAEQFETWLTRNIGEIEDYYEPIRHVISADCYNFKTLDNQMNYLDITSIADENDDLIFPDGMNGFNNVYDEIRGNIATQRIGYQSISSLNLTKTTGNGKDIYYVSFPLAKVPVNASIKPNLLCEGFVPAAKSDTWVPGNIVLPNENTVIPAGCIGFVTSVNEYTDVTNFKARLGNITFYFELKNPVTYTLADEYKLPITFEESTDKRNIMLPFNNDEPFRTSPIFDVVYHSMQDNITNTVIKETQIEILDLTQ